MNFSAVIYPQFENEKKKKKILSQPSFYPIYLKKKIGLSNKLGMGFFFFNFKGLFTRSLHLSLQGINYVQKKKKNIKKNSGKKSITRWRCGFFFIICIVVINIPPPSWLLMIIILTIKIRRNCAGISRAWERDAIRIGRDFFDEGFFFRSEILTFFFFFKEPLEYNVMSRSRECDEIMRVRFLGLGNSGISKEGNFLLEILRCCLSAQKNIMMIITI